MCHLHVAATLQSSRWVVARGSVRARAAHRVTMTHPACLGLAARLDMNAAAHRKKPTAQGDMPGESSDDCAAMAVEEGEMERRNDPLAQNVTSGSSRPAIATWFTVDLVDQTWAEPASFYTPMFVCEFLSFLVICLGWSGFKHEDDAKSAANLLKSNQIPSGLLVYMLGQFLIIVADRAIHLNRSLKSKLVLYYFLLGFVHLLVFYLIPLETGRSAGNNAVLIVLYLLKVCYFFISAAQIRATYPISVVRSDLTREYTLTNYIIYSVYRAVPFLFEIRMLLDWTCTPTTLELQGWFKMEDIYGQVYVAAQP